MLIQKICPSNIFQWVRQKYISTRFKYSEVNEITKWKLWVLPAWHLIMSLSYILVAWYGMATALFLYLWFTRGLCCTQCKDIVLGALALSVRTLWVHLHSVSGRCGYTYTQCQAVLLLSTVRMSLCLDIWWYVDFVVYDCLYIMG